MNWYKVSLIGWGVALLQSVLAAFMIYGYVSFEREAPAMELFEGAFYIHIGLVVVLLYARFKKHKLFAA